MDDELRNKIDRESERYIDSPDRCVYCSNVIPESFPVRDICPECFDLLGLIEPE